MFHIRIFCNKQEMHSARESSEKVTISEKIEQASTHVSVDAEIQDLEHDDGGLFGRQGEDESGRDRPRQEVGPSYHACPLVSLLPFHHLVTRLTWSGRCTF